MWRPAWRSNHPREALSPLRRARRQRLQVLAVRGGRAAQAD
jgi:hypothetical protein